MSLLLGNWREGPRVEWPDIGYRWSLRQFGLEVADLLKFGNPMLRETFLGHRDVLVLVQSECSRRSTRPVLAHIGRSIPGHGYASGYVVTSSVTTLVTGGYA